MPAAAGTGVLGERGRPARLPEGLPWGRGWSEPPECSSGCPVPGGSERIKLFRSGRDGARSRLRSRCGGWSARAGKRLSGPGRLCQRCPFRAAHLREVDRAGDTPPLPTKHSAAGKAFGKAKGDPRVPRRAEGTNPHTPCRVRPSRVQEADSTDVPSLLAVVVTEISASMGDLLVFALALLTLSRPGLTSCHFLRWKY